MIRSLYFGEVERRTLWQGHIENMSKRYRLGTTSTSYPDAQKVGWSNAVWRNTCKLQPTDSPRGLVAGNFFFQIPCLDRVSIPPCQLNNNGDGITNGLLLQRNANNWQVRFEPPTTTVRRYRNWCFWQVYVYFTLLENHFVFPWLWFTYQMQWLASVLNQNGH